MPYDDIVKPAKTGDNTAKNGQGTIGVPGLTVRQDIVGGQSNPVAAAESRLTDRLDDVEYYHKAVPEIALPLTIFLSDPSSNGGGSYTFTWTGGEGADEFDFYLGAGSLYQSNVTSPYTPIDTFSPFAAFYIVGRNAAGQTLSNVVLTGF